MFYFTETNTGSQIALESNEVKIMWQEGTGTIIYGTKANRVYASAEGIAVIYARNAPQDMILVTDTLSGKLVAIPLYAIKDIRPALTGGGSVVYYGGTKVKQQGVNETVVAIVNALAASIAGPTVNAFARHPNALIDPTLYHTIRIGLTNGSFFPLDLAPILGSTENTMYVSKNGNDTLALAAGGYNQHQPWKNPTVAMASAVSGDTVVVMPGVYTIGDVGGEDISDDGSQQMVRNGVVLYMLPGAEIQYTNLTAADGLASLPFADGGVASSFVIRGSGKFKFNRNISGGDSFLCTTHVDTVLDWEFDEIDIRRRFGGNGHNADTWRMKGRKWLNRESMLYAFRFPAVGTVNRKVIIDVEKEEVGQEFVGNTLWTRSELRNFNGASYADIKVKEVIYPHGFLGGAFMQITDASIDSTINVDISNIKRTSDNGVYDYLILHFRDYSKGNISFRNIDTSTGLVANSGAAGASNSSTKRTESYQGVIRDGYVSAGNIVYFAQCNTTLNNITYKFDVIVDAQSVDYYSAYFQGAINSIVTGKITWRNTTNSPIASNTATGLFARLERLMLSEIPIGIDSVSNFHANPLNLRVISSYAANAVGANVNQLIETFFVDTAI